MSEPRMNQRRKIKITKILDLPAEWTLEQIRYKEHDGGLPPVTADEISSVIVEEVLPTTDPNQGGLFDDKAV